VPQIDRTQKWQTAEREGSAASQFFLPVRPCQSVSLLLYCARECHLSQGMCALRSKPVCVCFCFKPSRLAAGSIKQSRFKYSSTQLQTHTSIRVLNSSTQLQTHTSIRVLNYKRIHEPSSCQHFERTNPPPPGGVSYLLCSLIKDRV